MVQRHWGLDRWIVDNPNGVKRFDSPGQAPPHSCIFDLPSSSAVGLAQMVQRHWGLDRWIVDNPNGARGFDVPKTPPKK